LLFGLSKALYDTALPGYNEVIVMGLAHIAGYRNKQKQ